MKTTTKTYSVYGIEGLDYEEVDVIRSAVDRFIADKSYWLDDDIDDFTKEHTRDILHELSELLGDL